MLLMSENIKDKLNVEELYSEELSNNVYSNTDTFLDLKVKLVFSDTTITGRVSELEKKAAASSNDNKTVFESTSPDLKVVFTTTPKMGVEFVLSEDLKQMSLTKDENLVFNRNIEPNCTIITNTKTSDFNETVCTLSINYYQK